MPEGRLEKAGLEEWIDEMRVTVLSKDTLMREGLLSMLAHQTAFRVAGGTDSVASLPQTVRETQSDLVVVDAATLGPKDWGCVQDAREEGARVVVIASSSSSRIEEEFADAVAQRAGGSAALFQALRQASGNAIASSPVRESVPYYGSYPRMLTPREHEVAQMVAQGLPNRRIAQTLGLREQSIKNLVSTVMRKLDCENRVQVALKLASRS